MSRFRCGLMPFAAVVFLASSTFVQADDTKAALDEIAGFAERVCATAPAKGASSDLELSGQTNAELKGLVSKVAGLGISGAAKYKSEESEGVLQKDLAPLLSKSADCRERVTMKLIEKLIRPTPPRTDPATHDHDPDTIYQHGMDVGHVTGADPHPNQSVVYFLRISDTQNLDRNQDFQYRKWILHYAGDRGSSGISFAGGGPNMAVLDSPMCKIVGAVVDPNSP